MKKLTFKCPNYTKWKINSRILNEISEFVVNQRNEISGAILFDRNTHVSDRFVISEAMGQVDMVDIVYNDEHVVSFHTHPLSAYKNAECVYGHTSSDDLVQYVRLAKKHGLIMHAVFSLEGVYLIQVRPSFVRWIRNIKKRETIYNQIDAFFRPYHGKRRRDTAEETNYHPLVFERTVNSYSIQDFKPFRCIFHPSNYIRFRCDDLWKTVHQNSHTGVIIKYGRCLEFNFMENTSRNEYISNVINDCYNEEEISS